MERETRVLVVGSGIAGLSAAIALADAGIETTVVTAAASLAQTNTLWAQGGIIYQSLRQDPDQLVEDILEAGCRINYLPAVRQLAEQGPRLVKSLLIERAVVPFDRDQDDAFHLTREGGHAESRILHKGDESGRTIEEALVAYCRTLPQIQFLTGTTAVNLLMSSHHGLDRTQRHEVGRCFGAFVFDQGNRETYPIFAQHSLLATGGVGQLFLHNTNNQFARGDGIALADRAGCRLENLEYVQFHPTTFFQTGAPRFLVSEALRGEGAVLVNAAGERFLFSYLPEYAIPELAPRDRVSKAIHQEMLSSGGDCVFLDISHKPTAWVKERFPFVYRTCLQYGVDLTKEPIPVVPGAHYHCGGVWTDLDSRTSVPRLWAAGEVASTGLHGANRLASTSLLEGLVWGTRAGEGIAASLRVEGEVARPQIAPWKSETSHVDPSFLKQDWLMLQHTMWNYVGLIKTDARLSRAEGILTELFRGIDIFYRKAKLTDSLIGLRHATLVSRRILDACKANRRSLGCYQREETLEI